MDVIDMRGKPCPLPVIEAKKALRAAAPGAVVAILVDNEIAVQNLQKMAGDLGHGFQSDRNAEGGILVCMEVRIAVEAPGHADAGFLVTIGRDVMGGGDEALGRVLLKSFIHSLTELDAPPARMLFFNGGVHLTTEGSNVLADLETLAGRGTAIDSCGACLNFYGLTDRLRVGGVTNMLAIAEAMAKSKRTVAL